MEREETYIYENGKFPVVLHAFYYYPAASQAQRAAVCNGAGPRRFGWLIPDTFCGLCITESANNHDWQFQFGITIEDFNQANRTFRNNMLRQAEGLRLWEEGRNGGWIIRQLNEYKHGRRLEMIEEYYKAVCAFGGPAFWDKNYVGFDWFKIGHKNENLS